MTPPYNRSKQTAPNSAQSGWFQFQCASGAWWVSFAPGCPGRASLPSAPRLGEWPGTATSLGVHCKHRAKSVPSWNSGNTGWNPDQVLSEWKEVITHSEESIRGNFKSLCKPVCSYFSNYAFLRGNFFSIYSFSVTIMIKIVADFLWNNNTI